MSQPSVCAILLTADRPEMTRQAVECFRAQTYANKRLYVYDSGEVPVIDSLPDEFPKDGIVYHRTVRNGRTVGVLRNDANDWAADLDPRHPEILAHWDSDDYSHPNRIAEQVQLLQSSGADVVGYNEMLFWRKPKCEDCKFGSPIIESDESGEWHGTALGPHLCRGAGEAWLYSNKNPHYALGASLCYWRHVWERKPFDATSIGEDEKFIRGLKVAAVSSIPADRPLIVPTPVIQLAHDKEPRMIARIHGTNTSTAYSPRKMEKASEWRRVAEWDSYCQGVFA